MLPHWVWMLVLLLFIAEEAFARTFSIGPAAEHRCRKVYRTNCSPGRVCALQHYHSPLNITLPICLPDFLTKTEANPCDLQPDHGKCGARFIRWYYHKGHGVCKWFHYGGCEGNQNNFKGKQECESLCKRIESSDENSAHRRKNTISLPLIIPKSVRKSKTRYNPPNLNIISPPKKMKELLDLHNNRGRSLKSGKKKHRRAARKTRRERKRFTKNKKKRRNGKIRRKGKKHRKNRRRRRNNKRRKNRRKHRKEKIAKEKNVEVSTVTVPIERVTAGNKLSVKKRISESTRTNSITPRKVLTVKQAPVTQPVKS